MDDLLHAGAASLSGQVEAAVKAGEAETGKVGQDYYTALSASSPAAAKGPAAGKGAAPAKGKAAKEEAATSAEVGRKHASNSTRALPMVRTYNTHLPQLQTTGSAGDRRVSPALFHESIHADTHRCTCSGQAACAPMLATLLTLLEALCYLIQQTQPVSMYKKVCAVTKVLPQLVMYEHTSSVLVADCARVVLGAITDPLAWLTGGQHSAGAHSCHLGGPAAAEQQDPAGAAAAAAGPPDCRSQATPCSGESPALLW